MIIEESRESIRLSEQNSMTSLDPMRNSPKFLTIGSHLAPMSKLEALGYVNKIFQTNYNINASKNLKPVKVDQSAIKDSVFEYRDAGELVQAIGSLHQAISRNIQIINTIMDKKDSSYDTLQQELIGQVVEKRKREEEVLVYEYITYRISLVMHT
jgi:hypothetical protein